MSRSIQTKIEFPLNDLKDRRREDRRTEAYLKLPTMLLNGKKSHLSVMFIVSSD